ncbi:hypothetical protein GCM10011369_00090 [Neiella marina]|uniref:Uncharacterized protein n=1 Tax=Neiella marina TaxID=508461 RepID=A0A8J2XKM0_9GAMM|nr:hypothetical protein [Neiella marina]GGA62816.1 hypothetical protein GCM10011369_00090 [Neiella marina]
MISSELIDNTASTECTEAVLDILGMDNPESGQVSYMVFETKFDNKQLYCCWSGGNVVDNKVELTPVGVGALDALSRIDADTREGIEMFVLSSNSREALIDEIKLALAKVADRSRVCFVGDVSGKLREWLPDAFNVTNWQH